MRTSTDQQSNKSSLSGASASANKGLAVKIRAYFKNHFQALFYSLGKISRHPLSSLMTLAVIGIALALPTGLHVVLLNVQGVSVGLDNTAQISLFLKKDIEHTDAIHLASDLRRLSEIKSVAHITPMDALTEFRELSGFGDVLNALDENPLPAVLVIQPAENFSSPGLVEALLHRLRDYPGVELVQLDMEWVKRLHALTEIGKRGVFVLAVMLALAVLLIVGNTIRLAIQNHRDEIEVQKLIGATDAFIQRPFLYSGIWHGLLGAVIAWLLVNISLLILSGPVQRLSLLYDSQIEIGSLGFVASILLLLFGLVLGLVGAWVAVGKHLREIEPG